MHQEVRDLKGAANFQ